MLLKAPRLMRNRHGTFCFRLKQGGAERRVSLGTKDARAAAILAFELNAHVERERAMKNPKISDILAKLDPKSVREYKLNLRDGTIEANGPKDHALAMDALGKAAKALPPGVMTIISPKSPAAPAQLKSPTLAAVGELWLAECEDKNAERTVYAKRRHLADLLKEVSGDLEINSIVKATMVALKTKWRNAGLTGKTIDNKLMSLHDLFKFALDHGHYTAGSANPVAGLFVLNRKTRVSKNRPYQPFTEDELRRFFDPANYLRSMGAMPDFFWAPLIGVYTGLRISEATAIAVADVQKAKNGVHFIQVPQGKTADAARNVPVCDALIKLGFLDYVAEARAAKVERIFPHRSLNKGTYSKRLSERMTSYLIEQQIKATDEQGRPLDDRKSFHSFRVNVITALANAGANTPQTMKIVGHKRGDGDAVHLGYVRDLPDLKKVVDKLAWPLDVKALRYRGQFKAFLSDPGQWDLRKAAATARHAKKRR